MNLPNILAQTGNAGSDEILLAFAELQEPAIVAVLAFVGIYFVIYGGRMALKIAREITK